MPASNKPSRPIHHCPRAEAESQFTVKPTMYLDMQIESQPRRKAATKPLQTTVNEIISYTGNASRPLKQRQLLSPALITLIFFHLRRRQCFVLDEIEKRVLNTA